MCLKAIAMAVQKKLRRMFLALVMQQESFEGNECVYALD